MKQREKLIEKSENPSEFRARIPSNNVSQIQAVMAQEGFPNCRWETGMAV